MIKIGYDSKYDYDERFTRAEPSDVKEHGIFYDCENKTFRLRCSRCGCVVEGRGEDVVHHGTGVYQMDTYINVQCPECGSHMDDNSIIWTREENADNVKREYGNMMSESKDGEDEALKRLKEARDALARSTYVTAKQLDRREEYYDTTHYLHISRQILSDKVPYELTKNLYLTMLDNPNCGGVVFGKMAPIEVVNCELSAEIVKMCVMRDKVVIFNPSESFELDSRYWEDKKE